MNAVVEKALGRWGMTGAAYRLIAARENRVYKVETQDGPVALRLHRQDYRSDQELASELAWMRAVMQGGINVPAPVVSRTQDYLQVVDGVQVDVLTWVSGATLTQVMTSCSLIEKSELFFRLGQAMARLHAVSDAWARPPGFRRCAWQTMSVGISHGWTKLEDAHETTVSFDRPDAWRRSIAPNRCSPRRNRARSATATPISRPSNSNFNSSSFRL